MSTEAERAILQKVYRLCCVWDPSGIYWGWQPCYVVDEWPKRVVLLNALVPVDNAIMLTKRIGAEVAAEVIKHAEEVISFIGHASTAKLLSQISGKEIPVNRGEWTPQDEEEYIIVARLKKRQQSPGDVEVTINDLEFWGVSMVRYNLI